jgi:hypothetical protein
MLGSIWRPLLLVLAGAVFGSLVTFGIFSQKASVAASPIQAADLHPPPTLALRQEKSDSGNLLETNTDSQEEDSIRAKAVHLAKREVPMRPVPKPTMAFQENGLPVGVKPNAGISDVYKRLPGVQPPLINRDGRDMGPEAVQMVETPREAVPFPGGVVPSAYSTPMPIPQTVEEANRQVQMQASPSE